MKKLIALLLAALMVCAAFTACGNKAADNDTTTTTTTAAPTDPADPTDPPADPTDPVDEPTDPVEEPTDPVEEPTDPVEEPGDPVEEPTYTSYEDIFAANNIVDTPALFIGMDSMSFAAAIEGMVQKIELGYKDDIVCEMVQVIYVDITGASEDEKAFLDTSMQEAMSVYTDMECCSNNSFNMTENYYIVSLTFSGLDNADTVKELADLGMIETDSATGHCSISVAEANLTDNGYLKK